MGWEFWNFQKSIGNKLTGKLSGWSSCQRHYFKKISGFAYSKRGTGKYLSKYFRGRRRIASCTGKRRTMLKTNWERKPLPALSSSSIIQWMSIFRLRGKKRGLLTLHWKIRSSVSRAVRFMLIRPKYYDQYIEINLSWTWTIISKVPYTPDLLLQSHKWKMEVFKRTNAHRSGSRTHRFMYKILSMKIYHGQASVVLRMPLS